MRKPGRLWGYLLVWAAMQFFFLLGTCGRTVYGKSNTIISSKAVVVCGPGSMLGWVVAGRRHTTYMECLTAKPPLTSKTDWVIDEHHQPMSRTQNRLEPITYDTVLSSLNSWTLPWAFTTILIHSSCTKWCWTSIHPIITQHFPKKMRLSSTLNPRLAAICQKPFSYNAGACIGVKKGMLSTPLKKEPKHKDQPHFTTRLLLLWPIKSPW